MERRERRMYVENELKIWKRITTLVLFLFILHLTSVFSDLITDVLENAEFQRSVGQFTGLWVESIESGRNAYFFIIIHIFLSVGSQSDHDVLVLSNRLHESDLTASVLSI